KLDESLARMGMIERLVSQGISAGSANANVLTAMLQQATDQEYATATDEKVRAREAAKAQANNLGTYQQAEDRERQHQAAMTGLAADLSHEPNQPPPGAPPAPRCRDTGPVFINNVANTDSEVRGGSTRHDCGQLLEAGWKMCPRCAKLL